MKTIVLLVVSSLTWMWTVRFWYEKNWRSLLTAEYKFFYLLFSFKRQNSKLFYYKIYFSLLMLACGLVFMQKQSDMFTAVILGVFLWGLILISLIDLKKQVIYTESILIEFILCISYLLNSKVILEIHVYGSLVGLLVMGFIYFGFLGGMGSGDVYLNTILGLWLGFPLIILCIIIAFMLAGIVGVYYLVRDVNNMKKNIPFAPFLSVASLISFYWGAEIIVCYQEIFS